VRIAVGNDHRGVNVKLSVVDLLNNLHHEYKDFGSNGTESVDYPDFAKSVAEAVSKGGYDYGILVCGTGIGMCIAANKIRGIRAALCRTVFDAVRARQHNDANVLCLASETVELSVNLEIVKAFLSSTFDGGRHMRRVDKVRALETDNLDNE
jgi:ribose 5-phosphate isomerase B